MKTRKLLALVLAIAVLASFISVPVFAEGEGEALEILGILIGTDEDGVTEEYLATTATRAQAALVNLRLVGQAEAAMLFDGTETFTDAADATEYWQPILEYLKATPAVGWNGYDDGSFMPLAAVTGQAFTKVLLVALGYEEGTDFTWETVMDFAATVGLTALADKADADLIVEDLAMALVEALGTKTNSPTDVTLLSQLVIDGVIDEADAVAAGFEVEEEALVIVDAYASSVDEVTVEMSTDVPEDAAITLKKGTAAYSVAEAIDGSTITLTALFDLPDGAYTVTVNDSSADFEVMDQYAVELVITADSVYLADGQDLGVAMYDQYGDKMSLSGTNYSVFNQNDGFVYSPSVDTAMEINVGQDAAAEADDVIFVFVYDPVSMLTVSGELPVIAAPYLETLAIGGVTIGKIGDDVQTMLLEGTQGSALAVTAYDQYGQEMTLGPVYDGMVLDPMFTTQVPFDYTAQVQILSSNSDVIDPSDLYVADGVFYFDLDSDAAGMAMLTFIIPDQANIYTTEMITVYATADVDSVVVTEPAGPLYALEAADFAVAGFDQYGAPIDVADDDRVTFTVTNAIFTGEIEMTDENEGTLEFAEAGSATVYYFLDGIFQGTFDVSAEAAAYPFQIVAVDRFVAMEEGTYQEILSADIEVIDQYGRSYTEREVDPFDGTGFTWRIMSNGATDLFNTHPWSEGYYDVGARMDTEDATGSETFVAKLIDENDGWKLMTESAFSFEIYNVATEDVTGFVMAAFEGTMYTGSDWSYHWDDAAEEYYKYVSITGEYDGMEVLLYDSQEDGLPDLIDVVTSTNDSVEVVSGSVVRATAEVDAGSTTIKAWRNGVAVAMADLALDDNAPDWTTTELDVEDGDEFSDWYEIFDLIDQYGVQISYTLASDDTSPDGMTPYVIEVFNEVGDDYYYTIIKWNGSLDETFVDVDGDDGFNPLP